MSSARLRDRAATDDEHSALRQTAQPTWLSLLRRVAPWSLLLVLIAEYGVFSAIQPRTFLTTDAITTILSSQAPLLMATLALTLTLTINEFDLTVGANLVFAEVIVAVLTVKFAVPLAIAAAIALVGAIAVGALAAYLVVGLGIRSFVATLAISTLLSGISLYATDSTFVPGVPHALAVVASSSVFGISLTVYYAFGLAVALWYVYEYTPLGRRMRFIGANVEVSRLSGVSTRRIRVGAFLISAALIGFAGLMEAGTIGSANPSGAPNYLLPAFAAAFLGATAVRVGRFNVWGTMIASYLLFTGITGLALLGLTGWVEDVFNGAALLAAVIAARLLNR